MKRGFEKISYEQWIKDTIVDVHGELYSFLLPKRMTKHSAGYDIFSPVDYELKPNDWVLLPTGFKAFMEPDEVLMVYPRGGMGFKYFARLANTVGVIDSDYYNNESNEGHCWVKLRNEGDSTIQIKKGSSIAQCIFQKYLLSDGDSFEDGEIRQGGFGSTNK